MGALLVEGAPIRDCIERDELLVPLAVPLGALVLLSAVRDAATRKRLHEFFRSLPGDRFPTLVAIGEHVWLDNRDERFAAGINALVDGLEQTQRPAPPPS